MAYERGDVVLVPFPFTDLSNTRTRPAVVVSTLRFTEATGDLTVAMITSVPKTSPYDCEIRGWQETRLRQPSWVRAKLATLSPGLVRFSPGRLSVSDLAAVDRCLSEALGLNAVRE